MQLETLRPRPRHSASSGCIAWCSRQPSQAEIALGQQFLAGEPAAEAWRNYCHLLLCTNEAIYVD